MANQHMTTAAFMATSSMKTGDPFYDIPITMILTVFIGVFVSMIGEFSGSIKIHVENFFLYLKRNVTEVIYGKMNYIIVESLVDNTVPNLNNKIIIDAVRSSFNEGIYGNR